MRRNKIVEENTLKDDGDDGTWPVIFKATAQHTRAMNVRSLSTHLANGLILATQDAIGAAKAMSLQPLATRRAEDIERASTRCLPPLLPGEPSQNLLVYSTLPKPSPQEGTPPRIQGCEI